MGLYKHNPGYIVAVVIGFIVFVFMLIMNGFAGVPVRPFFYNITGDVSDVYYTDLTPAGATFSIWGVIYAWQALWWAYAFSTLCRPGIDGHLYDSPGVLPVGIFVVYMVNNGLNIGWLLLWDRSIGNTIFLIPALVVIVLLPFTSFWCIFISVWALDRRTPALQQHGLMREVWMVRFMFQNGVAFYLTWTAIASLLNCAMVVHYNGLVDIYIAGSISLGILSSLVIVWFSLDMFALDRYVRYLFAPYAVLVWALGGVVGKNYPATSSAPGSDRNPYWEIALLAVSALALVIKIIVMIWRHFKRPLQVLDLTDSNEELKKTQYGATDPAISNPSFAKSAF